MNHSQKVNVLLVAFLDFEGAYDNVNHRLLLIKLANLGLPPKLVSYKIFHRIAKFHCLCRFSLFTPKDNNQRPSSGSSPQLPPFCPVSLGHEFPPNESTICWWSGTMVIWQHLWDCTVKAAKVTFPIWKILSTFRFTHCTYQVKNNPISPKAKSF